MCGRYTSIVIAKILAGHFDTPSFPEVGPRYNVSPSQFVPIVRLDGSGDREAVALKWGLIPSWADDPAIGFKMINARAETVAEKPAYRSAFKSRRCLVAADGFYEWRTEGKAKTPVYFHLADGSPFAFAGIWEKWSRGDAPVESFSLITTTPNELVAPVHDRMPVMLHAEDYDHWLDPKAKPLDLVSMLAPFPAGLMVGHVVGKAVGNPKNDGPECIVPVG